MLPEAADHGDLQGLLRDFRVFFLAETAVLLVRLQPSSFPIWSACFLPAQSDVFNPLTHADSVA
ncbi:hypothetical protein GCM10009095_23710 [Sphingomonas molluscorum]